MVRHILLLSVDQPKHPYHHSNRPYHRRTLNKICQGMVFQVAADCEEGVPVRSSVHPLCLAIPRLSVMTKGCG